MAEPIARAIVRDVDQVLQEFGIRLELLDEATQQRIQDRLVHVVDVHIKRAVLRVLEEPVDEPLVSARVSR